MIVSRIPTICSQINTRETAVIINLSVLVLKCAIDIFSQCTHEVRVCGPNPNANRGSYPDCQPTFWLHWLLVLNTAWSALIGINRCRVQPAGQMKLDATSCTDIQSTLIFGWIWTFDQHKIQISDRCQKLSINACNKQMFAYLFRNFFISATSSCHMWWGCFSMWGTSSQFHCHQLNPASSSTLCHSLLTSQREVHIQFIQYFCPSTSLLLS